MRLLRQPSTWQGIIGVAGVIGLNITPEYQQVIMEVAGAIIFLIHMLKDDAKPLGEMQLDINKLNKTQIRQLLNKGVQAGVLRIKGSGKV